MQTKKMKIPSTVLTGKLIFLPEFFVKKIKIIFVIFAPLKACIAKCVHKDGSLTYHKLF